MKIQIRHTIVSGFWPRICHTQLYTYLSTIHLLQHTEHIEQKWINFNYVAAAIRSIYTLLHISDYCVLLLLLLLLSAEWY